MDFPHNSRSQIPLGIEHITILIGIFINQCMVFMQKTSDSEVDIGRAAAFEVTGCPVVDIFFGQLVLLIIQQCVLHDILYFINLHICLKTVGNFRIDAVDNVFDALLRQRVQSPFILISALTKALYIFSSSKSTTRPSLLMTFHIV